MNILVTGGTGFIGSHTIVELYKAGHKAIIVDNLYNSNKEVLNRLKELTKQDIKLYEVDIRDKKSLSKVFEENKFDACIHFAGLKAVGESVSKPLEYYDNNISGSLVLYDLLIKNNVNNIVFSSSATVYGDEFKAPFKEEYGRGKTTNPYGTTKLMNEMILEDLCNANKDLSTVILRYFNPIGAHPSGLLGEDPKGIPNNLVPYIAKVVKGDLEKLSVYGDDYETFDGTGVRDYIHVVDLARAHVKAIEYASTHKGYEVINIGTGTGCSVLQVIRSYEKAADKKIPYVITERRAGDIAVSFADPSKAEKLLDFKAEYDIDDMCKDSFNFNEKNPEGIK